MVRGNDQTSQGLWDLAIIGGGVVGCAIARRLTLEGHRVVLVEKGPDILSGASKANSALLHTGFDAPEASLELACVRAGWQEYHEVRERLGLPVLETGAAVVAWTAEEEVRLDAILAQARRNGVADTRRLGRDALLTRVPGLSPEARGAVWVSGEQVIDPWSAPLAYITQAVLNGAQVRFHTEVLGGQYDPARGWRLDTTRGPLACRGVINAAGLFGDRVDQALLGECDFEIRPRKGQFVVLDKAASAHLGTILLPVPTERTKGIVLTPTIFGNLLVGPTAEEQGDRERATVEKDTLRQLLAHAARVVPSLRRLPVTAVYAGLRPATERKEYRVTARPERAWITVGGIRSTGLSAALGLARHVADLWQAMGHPPQPLTDPVWPRLPNLAEHRPRDWHADAPGDIVCHCELVTRREIVAALNSPVPAGDAGGLKRRTRVGMGRCQGFHCLPRVAELTLGRFATPLDTGRAADA